ncbi:MAG TPA: nitronate monooxygenase, partial [Candidatus Eisenbacteria bacterium]
NMATLYGAMLAGVHVVIMGAGIPREIPGVLDQLAEHRRATLRFDVEHLSTGRQEFLRFDPARHWRAPAPLVRPQFLAIVSSNVLATTLARKSNGRVDGFVVEGPTAGGHNAPPRRDPHLAPGASPTWGERDVVDLGKLGELGLPFWLAGGMGSPRALGKALAAGASGVQVGTLFAFCEESGFEPALKARILTALLRGDIDVRTDGQASPTGYPFKSLHLRNDPEDVRREARTRVCDLGYLRTPFQSADGMIRYRCPAEPVEAWMKKGGDPAATVNRRCLCNGLLAAVGQGQWRRTEGREPTVVTCGSDLEDLRALLAGRTGYTADDVIDWMLADSVVYR